MRNDRHHRLLISALICIFTIINSLYLVAENVAHGSITSVAAACCKINQCGDNIQLTVTTGGKLIDGCESTGACPATKACIWCSGVATENHCVSKPGSSLSCEAERNQLRTCGSQVSFACAAAAGSPSGCCPAASVGGTPLLKDCKASSCSQTVCP